jgi:flagellar biosynthesis protein FlhA
LGDGLGVLGLVFTLIVPVSPALLDVLVAFNLSISLLLLLVTMNARKRERALDVPDDPLFTTLFRLGLNVASTRLILTDGEPGTIIKAFGEYVGGDNLAVGLGRVPDPDHHPVRGDHEGLGPISEVAARFVLDAMPGKQMAIDADLNSGLIDATEARERARGRAEAEFYGAMDGASKFVRGDAIAGLIITALNLVGRHRHGQLRRRLAGRRGRPLLQAHDRRRLVSQIPALFISTAAAVLVTKNTSEDSLGAELLGQVGGQPRAR